MSDGPDQNPAPPEPEGPAAASGDEAPDRGAENPDFIVAEKLTKYYGEFTAIENISFAVKRGSVTAFLGPNGAGKSTVMRILTGYLAPTYGRALIAGHDVEEEREAASRRLGYLPENGPLYDDMTPSSFLRYVGSIRGMRGGELNAALDRVTAGCGLAEVWHRNIKKLSKGFRQRVGLAQAMLHDPDVLILDEPTVGLDPTQITKVRELITGLAVTKTVLLSTHILREVEAMADAMIVVDQGRKVFDGTPDEFKGTAELEERFLELAKGDAA